MVPHAAVLIKCDSLGWGTQNSPQDEVGHFGGASCRGGIRLQSRSGVLEFGLCRQRTGTQGVEQGGAGRPQEALLH